MPVPSGCIWSESSFSFSSTGVSEEWRRDLNKNLIQRNTQKADTHTSTSGHQQHREVVKAHIQLFLEMVFSLVVVAIPLSVHAGIFPDLFAESATSTVQVAPSPESPTDVPLLAAQQNPDPQGGRGGSDVMVDENALVSTGPIGADEIAASASNNGEISVYTVREGDSLSQVAEMFGVTANTIMWANDITRSNGIRPGDTLVILPIAGVRHVVKSGDSIKSIATKYEGNVDEILAYNQLDSASDLKVGDTLIIPGGAMHATVAKTNSSGSANPTKVTGGVASTGFTHPAPGSVKTQGIHGYNAVDLAGSMGSTIRAAASGEVIVAKNGGWNGGYGSYIVIRHKNGTQTLYAHLSSLNVGVGSYVEQGQTIGGMGNTGKSTGTHLHFEVRGGKNPF